MTAKSGTPYWDSLAIASVFFGSISTGALLIFLEMFALKVQFGPDEEFFLPFLCADALCIFISIATALASLAESNHYPGTRETGTARTGLVLGMIGALAPLGVFAMVMSFYARPGW